jgi:multiple sugar transport system substrate-binding protein
VTAHGESPSLMARAKALLPLIPRTVGTAGLLVLVVVYLVVGQAPPSTPTLVLATAADPRVPAGEEGVYGQLVDSAVEQWQEEYPGYDVDIRLLSLSADQQRAQFGAAARGEAETYDIISVDNQWVPEFAEREVIRPVDSGPATVGRGSTLDAWIDSVTYDGRRWAAPFLADVGLIYYRPDLIAPDTMTEALNSDEPVEALLELGESTASAYGLSSGYAGQFANYEGLTVNTLELDLNSATPQLMPDSEDGGSPLSAWPQRCATEDGLENRLHSAEILRDHLDADAAVPLDALEDTELDSLERFRAGESAILRHWPYSRHVLSQGTTGESDDDGEQGEEAGTSEEYPGLEFADWHPEEASTSPAFAITTWPQGGILGGQSFAVTTGSEHPEAAAALIKELVEFEAQLLLYGAGFAPANRDVLIHVQERDLLNALDGAVQRPVTPHYHRFSQILSDSVHDYLSVGTWPDSFGTALHPAPCILR